jgi:hypothetical protein
MLVIDISESGVVPVYGFATIRTGFFTTLQLAVAFVALPTATRHDETTTSTFLGDLTERRATGRTGFKLQILRIAHRLSSVHLRLVNDMVYTPGFFTVLVSYIHRCCAALVMRQDPKWNLSVGEPVDQVFDPIDTLRPQEMQIGYVGLRLQIIIGAVKFVLGQYLDATTGAQHRCG